MSNYGNPPRLKAMVRFHLAVSLVYGLLKRVKNSATIKRKNNKD